VAEDLELWTERTPEMPISSALDAHRPTHEPASVDTTIEVPKAGRERGPFLTYLCLPWSYGDRDRRQIWRRIQCRRRRHEMAGGHTVHLGGSLVFIERQCRWCGVEPGELNPS